MSDFIVSLLVWFGLLGLGLALLAAKWPRYWKPVLGAYMEVVKVSAVLGLNCVYFMIVAATRLIQYVGRGLLRRPS